MDRLRWLPVKTIFWIAIFLTCAGISWVVFDDFGFHYVIAAGVVASAYVLICIDGHPKDQLTPKEPDKPRNGFFVFLVSLLIGLLWPALPILIAAGRVKTDDTDGAA